MGSKSPEQICITLGCAPGDITCLTALPRDIMLTYPDKYEIHVSTHCLSLWDHNPHIAGQHRRVPNGMREIRVNYGRYISQANKNKMHFVTAFHREFARRGGCDVPCLLSKGDLHLPPEKLANSPVDGRYWIVVPGHKADFTTKGWSAYRYQQVVDKLAAQGLRFVQCGSKNGNNTNPQLHGVADLVGETNLRDLLWLIHHADGVICPITCFMHMAACLDKPCVVVAGGREHWWWEAYVNVQDIETFGPYAQPVTVPHRYLHTQGLLDCCQARGCWKNKVLHTQNDKNRSYCKQPTDDGYGQTIPECMRMITVDHVTEAVMSYYNDGTLPPIGDPKALVLPEFPAPPKKVLKQTIDLFAAPAEILADAPRTADVPTMVKAFEGAKKKQAPTTAAATVLDDPIIGGKTTICCLMYGDYFEMHRACLGSILRTTHQDRREIRVVTNKLAIPTRAWLDKLHADGHIKVLKHNADNHKKYPAMRQLFHDPDNPIETKWIVWFDDDSIANRSPSWYEDLCAKIVYEYPKKARMVGDLRFFTLNPAQIEWAKSRPWWRGRQLQTKQKQEAPNGQHIWFAAGGFWALETEAMREAMIPDEDIGHNGGDYMVGLQLWQQGYRTAAWNNGKKHVHTSSVGRRGLNEVHTGMPNWQPGGVSKSRKTVV